jgi:hypothetical protein
MNIRDGSATSFPWANVFAAGVIVGLLAPVMPLVLGAIEIARYDTDTAIEWLSTATIHDTLVEFFRVLGDMFFDS